MSLLRVRRWGTRWDRWEGAETWFSGTHHTPISYLKGDYGGGILRAWGWVPA